MHSRSLRSFGLTSMLCASLLLGSACSKMPEKSQAKNNKKETVVTDSDPLEPMNRGIYQVNRVLDGLILKPVTQMYRGVVPGRGQEMVSNAVDNIMSPVVFANSVLQLDPQNSFATLWRFLINSTVGVGGLFDAATAVGLKNRSADFGQTLALYGAEDGAFIMLPIFGPANVRDTVGLVGDMAMNPITYAPDTTRMSVGITTAIDKRSRNMKLIDDIYSSSIDPYATFRSGYTQRRAAEISKARDAVKKAQDAALSNGGAK